MIFELVSGDVNKELMAETEMKNRGDKIVSFIICKLSTNCAHGRLFIFWDRILREKRIRFYELVLLVQENECLYDDHSVHTSTYPVLEPQNTFYPKA
jgi:hypothetical protein